MVNVGDAVAAALPKLASSPPSGSLVTGSDPSVSLGSGSSGISSVLPIASIVVEILALVVVVAVVGLFIIIVVANRADPDATGRRPQSVYFFAVSFVTLVITIIGSIVIVFSLVQLIGRHGPGIGNEIARAVVIGGLIMVISGALLITHLRRGVAIVGADLASPTRRVAQSYVSGVAFLSVLILLVTTILTVYLLFALGGPGVFGSFGGRTSALRDLIDALYVAVVAGTVFLTHRNLVAPGLQIFGSSSSSSSSAPKGRHASDDPAPLAPPPPTFDPPA